MRNLIFLALLAIPLQSFANGCGFSLTDGRISKQDHGVPLYVERGSFSSDILKKLKHQALLDEPKLISEAGTCPETNKKVEKVLAKLLKGSGLDFIMKGPDALELIVLCEKTKSAPVARLRSAKYLVVPASLPINVKGEAHMAAVIAHEIAHYTLAHHARLMSMTNGRMPAIAPNWRSKISSIRKEHEREADLTGLKLMANAGYNARSAIEHLKAVQAYTTKKLSHMKRKLQRAPNASHPNPSERVQEISMQIQKCGYENVKAGSNPSNS